MFRCALHETVSDSFPDTGIFTVGISSWGAGMRSSILLTNSTLAILIRGSVFFVPVMRITTLFTASCMPKSRTRVPLASTLRLAADTLAPSALLILRIPVFAAACPSERENTVSCSPPFPSSQTTTASPSAIPLVMVPSFSSIGACIVIPWISGVGTCWSASVNSSPAGLSFEIALSRSKGLRVMSPSPFIKLRMLPSTVVSSDA